MENSVRSAILVMLAGATPIAAAQSIPEHAALNDKFYLGIGGFFPQTSTNGQLTSNRIGVGANIDFENALGMESAKSVPFGFARWRVTDRWRVEGEYFKLDRTGSRAIDRTINWGDQTFPINARVDSTFNFSDLRISGGYSFFKTKDKELGVGLGLHVASYDATLASNGIGSQTEKVTAPLPVLSVYGQFALTDHWAVAGRMDRFALKYDKFNGNLSGIGLDLMYQPFKHVGFGLGTRALTIKMDATENDRTAQFRQSYQGPVVYMNVSF